MLWCSSALDVSIRSRLVLFVLVTHLCSRYEQFETWGSTLTQMSPRVFTPLPTTRTRTRTRPDPTRPDPTRPDQRQSLRTCRRPARIRRTWSQTRVSDKVWSGPPSGMWTHTVVVLLTFILIFTYYYYYSITPSLFHSRLKTFLSCKSFPPQPSFSPSGLTPRIPRTVYRYV